MKYFLALILFTSLIGCGGASVPQDTEVRLSLPAAFVAQESVDRIVLRVTAEDLANPIIQIIRPPFESSITLDETIPIGKRRRFEVFAPLSGGENHMMYGSQVLDVTLSEAGVLDLPTLPMSFVNFAQDAQGLADIANPEGPDMLGFRIYQVPEGADHFCSGSIAIEINYDQVFSLPSVDTRSYLNTIIEFDTDENSETGSTVSRIENARGSLSNAFTRGTDLELIIQNQRESARPPVEGEESIPVFPTNAVFPFDVSGNEDSPLGEWPARTTFNTFTNTQTICIGTDALSDIDPDLKGRLNIITGVDTLAIVREGSEGEPVFPFIGNDIMYRSGPILYDINLNLANIPGASEPAEEALVAE